MDRGKLAGVPVFVGGGGVNRFEYGRAPTATAAAMTTTENTRNRAAHRQ